MGLLGAQCAHGWLSPVALVKRALLIGSEVDGLKGVARDVAAMDEVLRGLGFVTVPATGPDASADGVVAHLRDLVDDTTDADAAVIYFSGHGGRVRNPVPRSDVPRWLQYLVPTDIADRSGGRARCVLAEELSCYQAELTSRSTNVTTILDCCHAARMSRDAAMIPRALGPSTLPLDDLQRRWSSLRADPWPSGNGIDSNSDAVRVVACSADQVAYEMADAALGGQHGVLTAALVHVLTHMDPETVTWADVLGMVRASVMDVVMQRPEIEGPVDRVVFTTDRRGMVGVRPVRTVEGRAVLDGAALFGAAPGDTYAIVAPGGHVTAPLARATVERVTSGRAVLHLDPPSTTLPAGTTAWPVVVALGARPVAVVQAGGGDERVEFVAALTETAQVRVVDDPVGALATVECGVPGVVQMRDAAGEPLYDESAAKSPAAVAADVRRLARAAHLRGLGSGTGTEELPDDVTVAWLRLLPRGGEEALAGGEHLFVGDRLLGRFTHTGTGRRFVTALDVGLTGAVTLLTTAEPDGRELAPGEAYELGRDWYGATGVPLFWPAGLPVGGPRAESVVTLVADDRIDGLRALEQDGAGQVRSAAPPGTSLGRLLANLAVGRRDLAPPEGSMPVVRYRVHRFDFVLHPIPRVDAAPEPAFVIDERPDTSFRLVVPRGSAPPRGVAVRLRRLEVRRDREWPASGVRVDALAVTAVPTAQGPPFQAGTARSASVFAGDRPSAADLLVHTGPVNRFVDLAVWSAPDDPRVPELVDLLARETGDEDVAEAMATLAGLAAAAPAPVLIARSVAAVATLVNTADRVIRKACGTSARLYRTCLLPHRRFGVGTAVDSGLDDRNVGPGQVSFAVEVVDALAVVGAGRGAR